MANSGYPGGVDAPIVVVPRGETVLHAPDPGSVVIYLSPCITSDDVVGRGVVTHDPVRDPFTGAAWLQVQVARGVHAAIPLANVLAVRPREEPWC